jgi:O-glycosyl hydrolase
VNTIYRRDFRFVADWEVSDFAKQWRDPNLADPRTTKFMHGKDAQVIQMLRKMDGN